MPSNIEIIADQLADAIRRADLADTRTARAERRLASAGDGMGELEGARQALADAIGDDGEPEWDTIIARVKRLREIEDHMDNRDYMEAAATELEMTIELLGALGYDPEDDLPEWDEALAEVNGVVVMLANTRAALKK